MKMPLLTSNGVLGVDCRLTGTATPNVTCTWTDTLRRVVITFLIELSPLVSPKLQIIALAFGHKWLSRIRKTEFAVRSCVSNTCPKLRSWVLIPVRPDDVLKVCHHLTRARGFQQTVNVWLSLFNAALNQTRSHSLVKCWCYDYCLCWTGSRTRLTFESKILHGKDSWSFSYNH